MRPSKDTISRNMKAFFTLFLAGALIGPFFYCTQNELPESVQGQRSAFKIEGGGTFSKTGSSQYSPILLKMTGGTHEGKLVLLYGTNENLTAATQCGASSANKHNIMVAVSTQKYDGSYSIGNLPKFNKAKILKDHDGECFNKTDKIQFTAAWSNILTSSSPPPTFEKGIKYYQFDDSKLKTATILASTLSTGPQTGALAPLTNTHTQSTIPLGANSFKFGSNTGPIDYILTYKEARDEQDQKFYELYFFNHDQAVNGLEVVKVFGAAFSEKPTGAALLSSQSNEDNNQITTRWLIGMEAITITSTIATSAPATPATTPRKNDVTINQTPSNPSAMVKDLWLTLASRGLWLTGMSALANETPARSFMVFSAGKLQTPLITGPSAPSSGPPTIISNTENIYAVTTHSLQQMWNLKKQPAGGPGGGPPPAGTGK